MTIQQKIMLASTDDHQVDINKNKKEIEIGLNFLIEWLKRCDSIRKLDFNPMPLAKSALNIATQKKIPPMKLETLRNRNSEIYQILQKL